MPRKTIPIEKIKREVNDFMVHSVDEDRDKRMGQFTLLESILHSTNNYEGYGYLTAEDMKQSINGKSVGINNQKGPQNTWFTNTDDTRRFYY